VAGADSDEDDDEDMVESPSKSSINKVLSGRVTKPVRASRAKVSYSESGDELEEKSDQMIKSEAASFAVQSGNGMTYGGDSFASHHGYTMGDENDDQFVGAHEYLEEDV
jgi:hypothetical protein